MIRILKKLGPGLLYAGAAVGVSHIVQSTRAGAEYGYVLILGIFFAHLFKYPFFEIGPRYAAVHGESLIQAYRKLGRFAVWIVLVLTVSTMFAIQAAVTVVTAGIALKITGLSWSPWFMSLVLLLLCAVILYVGRYQVLNNFMKFIMVVLSITTVVAAFSSLFTDHHFNSEQARFFSMRNEGDVSFLIAFLGWMPAPLEIAIWHSLWVVANQRSSKSDLTFGQQMMDFRVGFYSTAFLALCFLLLGANLIYGTGMELSPSGVVYAGQFMDIYTQIIGAWSYPVIAIAAFTTMFSTTLTCLDGSPRVITEILRGHRGHEPGHVHKSRMVHFGWMLVLIVGATLMLSHLISSMKQMVTIATTISFLTTPILAYLSLRIAKKGAGGHEWPKGTRLLAYGGFVFLLLFALYYLYFLLAV